jgi:hypothetical protein
MKTYLSFPVLDGRGYAVANMHLNFVLKFYMFYRNKIKEVLCEFIFDHFLWILIKLVT